MKCDKCKNKINSKNELCVGYGSIVRPFHKRCFDEFNSKATYKISSIELDKLKNVKRMSILSLTFSSIIMVILYIFLFEVYSIYNIGNVKILNTNLLAIYGLLILVIFSLYLYRPLSNLISIHKIENLKQ